MTCIICKCDEKLFFLKHQNNENCQALFHLNCVKELLQYSCKCPYCNDQIYKKLILPLKYNMLILLSIIMIFIIFNDFVFIFYCFVFLFNNFNFLTILILLSKPTVGGIIFCILNKNIKQELYYFKLYNWFLFFMVHHNFSYEMFENFIIYFQVINNKNLKSLGLILYLFFSSIFGNFNIIKLCFVFCLCFKDKFIKKHVIIHLNTFLINILEHFFYFGYFTNF